MTGEPLRRVPVGGPHGAPGGFRCFTLHGGGVPSGIEGVLLQRRRPTGQVAARSRGQSPRSVGSERLAAIRDNTSMVAWCSSTTRPWTCAHGSAPPHRLPLNASIPPQRSWPSGHLGCTSSEPVRPRLQIPTASVPGSSQNGASAAATSVAEWGCSTNAFGPATGDDRDRRRRNPLRSSRR